MATRPLRILFDAHPLLLQKTGVGYYEDSLIRELARQHPEDLELVGYYYDFLFHKKVTGLPNGQNIRYRRIAWIPGKVVNLLRRFGISPPIELLAGTRADFVLYPSYLGHRSLFRTPSAAVIHDLTFVDLPEYVASRNRHDLQRFIPKEIKRSRFVITVSEFSKQRLCDEFGMKPEDILVTPIPPQQAPPRTDKAAEAQTLRTLGITGKYLLTVGTVEPRKNLLKLLDAYQALPETLQAEYSLVIAGMVGWNCEEELARLAELQAAGRNVHHLGYVTDAQKAALYRNASLFTSASFYEGFGMPVLEAMGYGVPCAISDIPVFREVAGEAAVYFDQTDPKTVAEAWQQILTNPAGHAKLAEAGKRQAASYRWDKVAADVYDRIKAAVGAPKR